MQTATRYRWTSKDGYAHGVHAEIAKRILGRRLKRNECVHHVNEDKADNRGSNLVICTQPYHNMLHARMRALAATGNANARRCRFCHEYDDPQRLRIYVVTSPGRNPYEQVGHLHCIRSYEQAYRERTGK